MKPITIAIIGGGSAGLALASMLPQGMDIHIFEKEKIAGRKFLVAGKGGFNLSHEQTKEHLPNYYTPHPILKRALQAFDTLSTRDWLKDLGVDTYVGSSGRIFPITGIKPAEVLKAIKDRCMEKGVQFHHHHSFSGFDEQMRPIILHQEEKTTLHADYYVFSMGGASWSKTGSDGSWLKAFESIGIRSQPFGASNCGLNIEWNEAFVQEYEGKPLKNIAISCNGKYIKGEALITEYGLEGNAVYPISSLVREQIQAGHKPEIGLDLKPHNSIEELEKKIKGKSIKSKHYAYILNLDKCALALVKQWTDKATYLQTDSFVKSLKNLRIPVSSLRPIEEAISTVGGIDMDELNPDFSLKKCPEYHLMGEMLDWDAPTGGYLLQACFSMAARIASKFKTTIS